MVNAHMRIFTHACDHVSTQLCPHMTYYIWAARVRVALSACTMHSVHSARTDTIGTLSARLWVRLVRSSLHNVTARSAGNVRRTNCYLGGCVITEISVHEHS